MSTGKYMSAFHVEQSPMLGIFGCKTPTAACGTGVLLALLGAHRVQLSGGMNWHLLRAELLSIAKLRWK